MAKVRVYLTPFQDNGTYATEIEVTSDITRGGVGSINEKTDRNDFSIGLFRTSSLTIRLRNDHGRYSDINNPLSIFRFKRSQSKVRVTWTPDVDGTGTELDVFKGLLDDRPSSTNVRAQTINFACLGRDGIFQNTLVNFATVDALGTKNVENILETILNQTAITDVLTFSAGSVTPSNNVVYDSTAEFENQSVKEALDSLLLAGTSVLRISSDTITVSSRDATQPVTPVHTFYGQASEDGRENIVNIPSVQEGHQKLFNYLFWKDTSTFKQDASSVSRFGLRKKSIEVDGITTLATRESVLTATLGEFGVPKQKLKLMTVVEAATIALELNDRVSIDFPTIVLPPPWCG